MYKRLPKLIGIFGFYLCKNIFNNNNIVDSMLRDSCWKSKKKESSPVRQEGLSLYFCVMQIITSEAFSTACAMASNVDPAKCKFNVG